MRLTSGLLVTMLVGCGGNASGSIDAAGTGDVIGVIDGSTPTNVTLTLTNHPINAATFAFLVAYQDGPTGTWQLAPTPTGDTYTLPIFTGKYGFAWTCTTDVLRTVELGFFATDEHTSLAETIPPRCTDVNTTVKLTGTVSNRPNAGRTQVTFGDVTGGVEAGSGKYSLDVEPGTHDLVIAHSAGAVVTGTVDLVADQAIVVRDVAVTAATVQDVDFSTAAATTTLPVTVTLGPQERGVAVTTLFTANGTQADFVRDSTAPFESNVLPVGPSTDVYAQSIQVAGSGQTAIVTIATSTPGPQTYTAPTPLGGAITTSPALVPQLSTTWSAYVGAVGYGWSATQVLPMSQCGAGATAACTVIWGAEISAESLGAVVGFTQPPLESLAGWNPELDFAQSIMVTGFAEALTSTAGTTDFPPITPEDGWQRTAVRSDWTVTP